MSLWKPCRGMTLPVITTVVTSGMLFAQRLATRLLGCFPRVPDRQRASLLPKCHVQPEAEFAVNSSRGRRPPSLVSNFPTIVKRHIPPTLTQTDVDMQHTERTVRQTSGKRGEQCYRGLNNGARRSVYMSYVHAAQVTTTSLVP